MVCFVLEGVCFLFNIPSSYLSVHALASNWDYGGMRGVVGCSVSEVLGCSVSFCVKYCVGCYVSYCGELLSGVLCVLLC